MADRCGDPGFLCQIRIFPSRIQGPKDSGSRQIRIRITEFNYFLPIKLFLSCRKYDPGYLPRSQILNFCPSRIQGSKRHQVPDPDPHHWLWGRGSVLDPEMETANRFWTHHINSLYILTCRVSRYSNIYSSGHQRL